MTKKELNNLIDLLNKFYREHDTDLSDSDMPDIEQVIDMVCEILNKK